MRLGRETPGTVRQTTTAIALLVNIPQTAPSSLFQRTIAACIVYKVDLAAKGIKSEGAHILGVDSISINKYYRALAIIIV
jgi:hypothetical protein